MKTLYWLLYPGKAREHQVTYPPTRWTTFFQALQEVTLNFMWWLSIHKVPKTADQALKAAKQTV